VCGLQQHLHLDLLQRLPQLHRRLYGLVHRVQRLLRMQRLLGQLLQLQGGPVVCLMPRVHRLRRLPRLRWMLRELPECMLGLHLLQHQLQHKLQRQLLGCMQELLLKRLLELIKDWRLTCSYRFANPGCST
jgi:hypothetical protein